MMSRLSLFVLLVALTAACRSWHIVQTVLSQSDVEIAMMPPHRNLGQYLFQAPVQDNTTLTVSQL